MGIFASGRLSSARRRAAASYKREAGVEVVQVAADLTLTADDDGRLFVATAAVNFTLPAVVEGVVFRVLQSADANLTITCANSLVHKGSAVGDSVAFSTSSEKIGSHALVEGRLVGSALKWVVLNLGGTTATVTAA